MEYGQKYQNISTALIVDDDKATREILRDFVNYAKLTAITAENGSIATEILKKQKVDLLISDFHMPVMDGIELLKWVRGHSIHIPVIFISGSSNLFLHDQAALSDCCATLMLKPVELDRFLGIIGAADSRNHHIDCVHNKLGAVRTKLAY